MPSIRFAIALAAAGGLSLPILASSAGTSPANPFSNLGFDHEWVKEDSQASFQEVAPPSIDVSYIQGTDGFGTLGSSDPYEIDLYSLSSLSAGSIEHKDIP